MKTTTELDTEHPARRVRGYPHALLLPALACSALLQLNGCASKAANPPGTGAATVPWFCQVGETNDDWDCVQDQALAAQHEPTRLPEPRSQSEAASPPAPAPPPQPEQASSPTNNLAPAPVPIPVQKSTDLPLHVQLSYRPEKPVAIVDLPADYYAVQLVAVSSKEALERYARDQKLAGMSAARVWNAQQQQMYYVLLLGIYETRDKAERAVASLAGPLAELNAWVRTVGSLQAGMIEAEKISGTESY